MEYYAAIKNYTFEEHGKSIFSVKWEKNSKEVKLYTMWSQLFLFYMWVGACMQRMEEDIPNIISGYAQAVGF